MRVANSGRRRFLHASAAAGSLFLPVPYAWVWAQSEGTIRLLKAPKIALVVGNGKYKDAPELKNPPNDARAIGETLKAVGFDVAMKLDTGREEMLAAIRDYVHTMEQKKCVGLFYFAGHGVQLAWRNYLLPVDAVIDKIDDVAKQSIDIARLMEGLTKAANPMNVIILDACRENPFGSLKGADHKGLSQMDAPNNTIMSYATAPGNVASDGDGTNGLYTENFLREVKVPEAKVEDVFKRVRLGVRKKSNGAQVPWESSSLEDDFWFLPPKELKKLSDAQKAAEFKEELAAWERVKESSSADDLYAYLQKYPTGLIAEQAQFRLDQLQKPKVEAEAGANGIKPLASGANRYAVGDEAGYEIADLLKNSVSRPTLRVSVATADRVEFTGSSLVVDQMGSILRNEYGTKNPGILAIPADLSLGKRWRTAFTNTRPDGVVETNYYDNKVVALEQIQVPAGSYRAFKLEANGESLSTNPRTMTDVVSTIHVTRWVDPAAMISVRTLFEARWRGSPVIKTDSQLTSYKRAPR